MSGLRSAIDQRLAGAFGALGLPVDLARATASDRPDLADFQCNGALASAKRVGRNPREIAASVAEAMSSRSSEPLMTNLSCLTPKPQISRPEK